jgi:chromosomal replication initiator protein
VEIGTGFGGRDHTTVIYACDKMRELATHDPDHKRLLDELITQLTR